MNQTFEYSELALDSWDATTTGNVSSTNPELDKYSWPFFYFTSKQDAVAGFKIVSATIPYVFLAITSSNNTFTYTVSGTSYTITIPVTYYTATTLAAAIQVRMRLVTSSFTVTYSTTNQAYTFTQPSAVSWSISFPSRQSPYASIGFLPGAVYSATGSSSSITSVLAARPLGPDYLFVNSRKLGSLINFNLADGGSFGGSGNPQICRIPINATFGNTIIYTDPDTNKYFDLFVGQQFDAFDFYLTLGTDQSQTPLDMKGVSWSLKVGLLNYRKATDNLFEKPAASGSKIIR